MWALREIVVDIPDCPLVPPMALGMPSWVVGWGMAVLVVIVLTLTVAVGVVRFARNGELTVREKNYNEAVVSAAKLRKSCHTCGEVYDPSEELKK